MSKLAHKLKHRIQILQPTHTPSGDFTIRQSYVTLATVWAGIEDASRRADYIRSIRGVNEEYQSNDIYDTIFIVRFVAIKNLGTSFNSAFGEGMDSIPDLLSVKSDMHIFLQYGNNSTRGRLFKVVGIHRDDARKEFAKITAYFVEERGTGWPE